ncbi:MAG: hypothetical protein ACLGG0_13890 [Bacteriovoracia bacterium]
MDSTSNTSPEHDEKTGSFAPRTAGVAPQRPEKRSFKPSRRTLGLLAGIFLCAMALSFKFIYLPHLEEERNKLHPTRTLIAQVLQLSLEEETQGMGSAAEPPQEIRKATEALMTKMMKRFPDVQGVFTRCVLTNHDIHLIDPTGRILEHFPIDEEVPAHFQETRQLLSTLSFEENFVAVVRNNQTTIYDSNGDVVKK